MSARHKIIFKDRPKVRKKMTLRWPTLCRFKNRHKVRKKDTTSVNLTNRHKFRKKETTSGRHEIIFERLMLSQKKTTPRRANIKLFLKDQCKVITQMIQRRAAQVFFLLIISQFSLIKKGNGTNLGTFSFIKTTSERYIHKSA
jgi:hypothetical protein